MKTHLLVVSLVTGCLLTVSSSTVAQNVTAGNAKNSGAMPPPSIPTFSTENLGRMSHFYVGGHYVGAPGKEQMDGAMYVEVWVPKQIRQPYPVVMFHGNGQTDVGRRISEEEQVHAVADVTSSRAMPQSSMVLHCLH